MATSHVLAREALDLDVAPDGSGEHRRFLESLSMNMRSLS